MCSYVNTCKKKKNEKKKSTILKYLHQFKIKGSSVYFPTIIPGLQGST